MRAIERSGNRKGKYYSRTPLNREGTLILKCKVSSTFGETIEIGRATSISVLKGVRSGFLISKCIIQCKFGHLNSSSKEWQRYYRSSDALLEDDRISLKVIDFKYEYNTYNGSYKYKQISFKGKKYIQVFQKKGNRFVFAERHKVTYDKVKKINKIKTERNL